MYNLLYKKHEWYNTVKELETNNQFISFKSLNKIKIYKEYINIK